MCIQNSWFRFTRTHLFLSYHPMFEPWPKCPYSGCLTIEEEISLEYKRITFFQTFSMWHLWMFGFWPIFCTIVRYKISHLGCHTCYENTHFKSVWEGQLVHNNVCLEYRTQNILKEYDILDKYVTCMTP